MQNHYYQNTNKHNVSEAFLMPSNLDHKCRGQARDECETEKWRIVCSMCVLNFIPIPQCSELSHYNETDKLTNRMPNIQSKNNGTITTLKEGLGIYFQTYRCIKIRGHK